ncbi:MAG: hypothetical protein ACTHMJ_07320 [Thermomicrobiales bacterium]|jgi:hypothetical protein
MKFRLIALALTVALLGLFAVAPLSAGAAPPAPSSNLTVPITGSATNALGQLVTFAGNFTLQSITSQNGQLAAVGNLTGTLTNTVTGVTQAVNQLVTLPVTNATGTCQILDLTLGPLDLNLLGLMVHLNQVHLTITAQSGPGNLLGNLLCGVAHLLDSGAPASTLANVLNHLLALL